MRKSEDKLVSVLDNLPISNLNEVVDEDSSINEETETDERIYIVKINMKAQKDSCN